MIKSSTKMNLELKNKFLNNKEDFWSNNLTRLNVNRQKELNMMMDYINIINMRIMIMIVKKNSIMIYSFLNKFKDHRRKHVS